MPKNPNVKKESASRTQYERAVAELHDAMAFVERLCADSS